MFSLNILQLSLLLLLVIKRISLATPRRKSKFSSARNYTVILWSLSFDKDEERDIWAIFNTRVLSCTLFIINSHYSVPDANNRIHDCWKSHYSIHRRQKYQISYALKSFKLWFRYKHARHRQTFSVLIFLDTCYHHNNRSRTVSNDLHIQSVAISIAILRKSSSRRTYTLATYNADG